MCTKLLLSDIHTLSIPTPCTQSMIPPCTFKRMKKKKKTNNPVTEYSAPIPSASGHHYRSNRLPSRCLRPVQIFGDSDYLCMGYKSLGVRPSDTIIEPYIPREGFTYKAVQGPAKSCISSPAMTSSYMKKKRKAKKKRRHLTKVKKR